MLEARSWTSLDPDAPLRSLVPSAPLKVPLASHVLFYSVVENACKCRRCGRAARTPASLTASVTSGDA
eukprot:9472571-Pyramimonas_sp.AAC.1